MDEKVFFSNDRGLKLAGLFNKKSEKGIILSSHFTGFKEFAHLYNLASSFSENNFSPLRFDFSDCIGESEGVCEDMSVSHQARDVSSAIDFMQSQGIKDIGLFGHSLGGTTAIVAAANDKRVKVIVVAASLAKLNWDTLFTSKASQWKEQGFVTFPSWKKGEIKIKYGFYQDLAQYDATKLMQNIKIPSLVIHPGNDELVSLKNAEGIFNSANDPKELKIIQGSDHMFSNKEHEKQMIEASVDWFKKYL